jgi:thiol-disulfide isomerase/thioredoxin
MKKQWVLVAVILAVLTAAAVLAVRFSADIRPVEVSSRAPAFHAVNLATGDSTSLAAYRGKVVLLNVWATWCEPCRVEMPSMQRLQQALGGGDFVILAVSIDETGPEVVRLFQRQFGLTFTILQDRSRAIERIYQTTGVPESFVINRDGLIVKKVIGAHAWDAITEQELIRRLLAQRG